MTDRYDMVVVGGGPAGEKAATQAAYFGKRVAMVERRPDPGGIAVSDAGVPTKTLRETAQYLTGFRHRDVYGISLQLDASLKLERLKSRTHAVTQVMTTAVRGNLERMKVDFIQGEGRLTRDRGVRVALAGGGERTLSAEVVLVATGSRPLRPASIPFDDQTIFDSEGILHLQTLPKSMAVIGAGAVGCEYASIFTALGVEVTLLEATDRLLSFIDAEIASLLADAFRAQGMRIELRSGMVAITREGGRPALRWKDQSLHPQHVLFAGGRASNVEGLGLEEAGVALDARGRIQVDPKTFQTTAPGIYAAGDVIGPPALASVSQEQGRVAACHAFHLPFKERVDALPPFGVYSMPEVAMVGLTEEAARAQGIDVLCGRGHFARNTRARIAGVTEGLVKLVFRRADRGLVGVHILGDIAAELIHLGQMALSHGRPIDDFIHATFNVPTYSEAYKYAAYDGLQALARG
ncbi:MAG TPA: Si-specific NAD(P)(+) transhydrogenase [Myxococcaceae bacterium]|nr:Si-specific NAD(P)(+) transhydrogenase [Myxococcaceae bacterium]